MLREAFKVGKVYLKLENCRPTGSFKDRGMLLLCEKLKKDGVKRIICSSGGNAGLAATYAGKKLDLDVTVYVPSSTSEMMIDRIRKHGAEVIVHGSIWNEADEKAREVVEHDEGVAYVPPYDDELLWMGHSTMIDELYKQLNGIAPDVIVASVGGGGLLAGILIGLERRGVDWLENTRVIAAETEGTASMHEALKSGKPVKLEKIASIASSLGALQVCDGVLKMALNHPAGTYSVLVSDKEAMEGCMLLLNEHRILCEPACGAAVAACRKLGKSMSIDSKRQEELTVVIIVCGGGNISYDLLRYYLHSVGL